MGGHVELGVGKRVSAAGKTSDCRGEGGGYGGGIGELSAVQDKDLRTQCQQCKALSVCSDLREREELPERTQRDPDTISPPT